MTAVAWLTPFRADGSAGLYDAFASISFFARVFLWPVAAGWLVVAALSVIARHLWVAGISLILAAGWLAPEIWIAWPRSVVATGPTFSVTSLNLQRELRDATWAAEVLRKADADFIVLQKVTPQVGEQLKNQLAARFPHAMIYPHPGYDGMAVFSKSPLGLQRGPASYNDRDLAVTVNALGRTLTLVDVHLSPPHQIEKRRSNRMQTRRLIDRYADSNSPVMLVGDFNFTAMTPAAFELRRAGFADAKLTAGGGRQTTWPSRSSGSLVPTVRIDTAYGRGPLRAVGSEVLSAIGSDHLPIKTTWRFAD